MDFCNDSVVGSGLCVAAKWWVGDAYLFKASRLVPFKVFCPLSTALRLHADRSHHLHQFLEAVGLLFGRSRPERGR
jgi:hypothetical protein